MCLHLKEGLVLRFGLILGDFKVAIHEAGTCFEIKAIKKQEQFSNWVSR